MEEFYDEIELEDMEESEDYFTYPCPCGDIFIITKTDIQHGEDIAYCPSCTLKIRVIY